MIFESRVLDFTQRRKVTRWNAASIFNTQALRSDREWNQGGLSQALGGKQLTTNHRPPWNAVGNAARYSTGQATNHRPCGMLTAP